MTAPDTFAAGIEAAARLFDRRAETFRIRARLTRCSSNRDKFYREARILSDYAGDIRTLTPTVKDERDDG